MFFARIDLSKGFDGGDVSSLPLRFPSAIRYMVLKRANHRFRRTRCTRHGILTFSSPRPLYSFYVGLWPGYCNTPHLPHFDIRKAPLVLQVKRRKLNRCTCARDKSQGTSTSQVNTVVRREEGEERGVWTGYKITERLYLRADARVGRASR